MAKIKRILSAFAASIITLCAVCSVYAAEVNFQITVDKTELTAAEDTLEVSVDIANSEAVRGIQGTIAYNRDVLEIEEAEKGDVVFDGLAGDIEHETPGKVNFSVVYAEPTALSGNICRLTFRLKPDTNLEISEIRIKNIKIADAEAESQTHEDLYQTFDINLPEEQSPAPSVTPTPSSGGSHGGGASGPRYTPEPTAEVNETPEPTAEPTPSPEPETVFLDTEGHWAKADIEFLYEEGIVSGVTENTFEPDRSITRAEFTKLVSELLELNVAMPNVFSDVDEEAWYRQYVMLAYTAGIIQGDGETFRPNDELTRAELAVMADRICSYAELDMAEASEAELFLDDEQIPDWAKESVYNASAAGIVMGYENKFESDGITTRAQASAVIRRIYDLMDVSSGTLPV